MADVILVLQVKQAVIFCPQSLHLFDLCVVLDVQVVATGKVSQVLYLNDYVQ